MNQYPVVTALTKTGASGAADVYFIVGDPVGQAKAPETFNAIFAHFGIDAVLVPVCIAPDRLGEFVGAVFNAPNVKGLWVTIPHKAPIAGLLDRCSDLALLAGAVNAVRRERDGTLTGALFDGEGFTASLEFFGTVWSDRKALVVGAGGGAAAIGASLALGDGAVAQLDFYDPIPGKAAEVARRIQTVSRAVVGVADSPVPAGYDLVVHASPLGLSVGDALPLDVNLMKSGATLVDILMKNQPTPVVRAARARGLLAYPGFEMMIQQVPLYLDFFGFEAAAQWVRDDARPVRELIYPSEMLGEILPRTSGMPCG